MGLSSRTILSLLALCALVLSAAACGGEEQDRKTPADVPADAIALVGDTPIPRAEFDALIERAKENYKAQNRPFPAVGTPEYQELKTRAVAFLVRRYQYRAEAEELGIAVSDADVDKRLNEILEQNFGGDRKKLQQALQREGLTEAEAREEIRSQLLEQKLYDRVTADVEVTQDEIEQHYEKNKAEFTQPASRTVRHILVKERARANDLYQQLVNGANFAALAREHSDDEGSAQQGGRLPITRGQTVPNFDRVAFELDVGEISRPVKTQFGWHIIEAVSPVKPERVTPLADVQDSIRQQLVSTQQNEALRKWLEDLEKKYESQTVYAVGFEPPETETETGTGATTAPAPTTTVQE